MVSETLKKFADELKFIRESKAITLQQIASKTKIDLKLLQAIEDANFEILPEIYVRAFIKEYSQTLDLNPQETLQKFDNARSGKEEEKPTEVVHTEDHKQIVPEEGIPQSAEPVQTTKVLKRFSTQESITTQPIIPEVKTINAIKTNYIIGGLITVTAIIIIIYFSFFNGSSSEIIQIPTDQEVVSANNERFELGKQTSSKDQAEIQTPDNTPPLSPDSLYLSVLTTDRVWLKVSTDGKILRQGIVEANARISYAAKKNFSLSIGNAGRVKVYFNNTPVDTVGKPGEVRNLFITSDGIKYYTITPRKNEKKSTTTN